MSGQKSERKGLYMDPAQPVEKRVEDLLSRMTLEEKAAQLGSYWAYQFIEGKAFSEEKSKELLKNGLGQVTRIGGSSGLDPEDGARVANAIQKYVLENTRLGIPVMVHEESCSGYMAKGTTIFPQTLGVSCSWNPALVERMGGVIKTQMRAVGAHQALAPLMDVTRDPRWGRVEETYGEDPYLVSSMAVAYVRGLQDKSWDKGVMATGKHFAGYGNSEGGMNWAPAHIPQREFREVFLAPFEAVVKEAGLASIMPGYHELDGVPCHGNRELIDNILRKEWGFDGLVVSDYFAITQLNEYHHVAETNEAAAKLAIETGVDVELPNTDCYGATLVEAVRKGLISEAAVNKVVARVLTMKFKLGLFENPYVDADKVRDCIDTSEQRELARELARQSMVLLKNENSLLPIKKDIKSLAVIGPNADSIRNLLGDYTYPSHIETLMEVLEQNNYLNQPLPNRIDLSENFITIISILEGIKKKVSAGTKINYAKGCDVTGDSKEGFKEAVEAARKSDAALVFVGDMAGLIPAATVGESRDRAEIGLPGVQEELVKAVYETGTPTVVVLVNGRPFSINWIAENIPAVLEAWLPGEEGAGAVADVIFGDYNPGGKLSISVPRSSGQIPVYYYHKKSGGRSHWRGDYADMSTKPLYPFGYGLSYTRFEYRNLKITPSCTGINGKVDISLEVTNKGGVKGDEVVQLYVNDSVASVTRPVKELKGFVRVSLGAGETKKVTFGLSCAQLGFYDRDMRYVVEPGAINVMVGSSSEDIRLEGAFEITGEKAAPEGGKKVFFSSVSIE